MSNEEGAHLPLIVLVQTQRDGKEVNKWRRHLDKFEVVVYDGTGKKNDDAFFDALCWIRNTIEKNPQPVLVMIDTGLTHLSSHTFEDVLSRLLGSQLDFDLFYLCKWQDNVQRYREVHEIESGRASYYWSTSPCGLYAIMFQPETLNIIHNRTTMTDGRYFSCGGELVDLDTQLRNEIYNGNLKALVTVPNMIDFNPTYARIDTDYAKLQQATNFDMTQEQSVSSVATYIWFAIVVILMIVLAWFVLEVRHKSF